MHHRASADFGHAVQADRLAVAARRRPAADGSELALLVSAAADGDRRAWEALVARFQPSLLRAARARGLDAQQGEDAAQETWIRLLRNIRQVREPRALGGWLAKTMHHESLRVRARAARELPSADDLGTDIEDTTAFDAEGLLDGEARQAALRSALERLSPRHRRLMAALFAEVEQSYEEIATEHEIPVGSIGPTRRRCLAKLRLDGHLGQFAESLD